MQFENKPVLKNCFVKLERIDVDKSNDLIRITGPYEENIRKSSRVKVKNKKYDDFDTENLNLHIETKVKEEFDYDLESQVIRVDSKISDCYDSTIIEHPYLKNELSVILPKLNIFNIIKEPKKYSCKLCGVPFFKKLHLKRHHQNAHPRNKCYECIECTQKFTSKDFLVNHLKTAHDKIRPFLCTLCPGKGKAFTRKQCLTTHIRVAHRDLILNQNNPDIEVIIVDQYSASVVNPRFIKHEQNVGNTSITDENLESILNNNCSVPIENDEWKDGKVRLKYYRCHFCGKIFNQEAHLLRHVKSVHERVKPFKCYLCPKIPPNHFPLQTDEEIIGNEFTPRLAYPAGSKHTNSSAMLRDHYERDLKTGYWIKSFSRKEFLIKHLRSVHQGYRPYSCDLCGMKYCDKRDMENHKKKAHCLPSENVSLIVQTCPHPQCAHIIFTSKIHLSKHIKTFHNAHGTRDNSNGKKVPGAASIYLTTSPAIDENIQKSSNDILISKDLIAKDCSSILLTESNLLQINEEHAKNQTTHEIVNSSNLTVNPLARSSSFLQQNSSNNPSSFGSLMGGNGLTNFDENSTFLDERYGTLSDTFGVTNGLQMRGDSLANQFLNGITSSSITSTIPTLNTNRCLEDHHNSISTLAGQETTDKMHRQILLNATTSANTEEVLSYACEGCEKLFINRGALIRHFKSVHENHRAFICRICGRSFNQRPHLERHLSSLIHADVLKYACDYCGRRFALKSRLEKHLFDLNYHRDPNYVRVPKYVCYICTPAEALAIGDELDFIPDDSPFSALLTDAKRKGLLQHKCNNNNKEEVDKLSINILEEREPKSYDYDDLYKDIDNYGTERKRGRRRTVGFSSNEDKLLDVLTSKILKDYSHIFTNNTLSNETANLSLSPASSSAERIGIHISDEIPRQSSHIQFNQPKELLQLTDKDSGLQSHATENLYKDAFSDNFTGLNELNNYLDESTNNYLQYNIDDPTKSSFIKDSELRERLLKIRQSSIVRFGRKKDLIKHLKEAHYGQLAFGSPSTPVALATHPNLMDNGIFLATAATGARVVGNHTTQQQLTTTFKDEYQVETPIYRNVNPSQSLLLSQMPAEQTSVLSSNSPAENMQKMTTPFPTTDHQSAATFLNQLPREDNQLTIDSPPHADETNASMGGLYLDISNFVENLNTEGGTIILATNEEGQSDVLNITNLNQLNPQQLEQFALQFGKNQITVLAESQMGSSESVSDNTNFLTNLITTLQQQQQPQQRQPNINSEDNSLDELVKESHQQEMLSKQMSLSIHENMQDAQSCLNEIKNFTPTLLPHMNSPTLSGNTNTFIISNLAALNNSLGVATQKAHIDNLKSHLCSNFGASKSHINPSFFPSSSQSSLSSVVSSCDCSGNLSNPTTGDSGLTNVAAADLLLLPIYECKLCSKTFSSRVNLRRHDERVHGGEAKLNLLCEFCGKVFGYARTLRDHITVVHASASNNDSSLHDTFHSSNHGSPGIVNLMVPTNTALPDLNNSMDSTTNLSSVYSDNNETPNYMPTTNRLLNSLDEIVNSTNYGVFNLEEYQRKQLNNDPDIPDDKNLIKSFASSLSAYSGTQVILPESSLTEGFVTNQDSTSVTHVGLRYQNTSYNFIDKKDINSQNVTTSNDTAFF